MKGRSDDQQEELISALVTNYRTADLSSGDRTMLDYVVKLTLTPSEIDKQDVDGLRAAGFDDCEPLIGRLACWTLQIRARIMGPGRRGGAGRIT